MNVDKIYEEVGYIDDPSILMIIAEVIVRDDLADDKEWIANMLRRAIDKSKDLDELFGIVTSKAFHNYFDDKHCFRRALLRAIDVTNDSDELAHIADHIADEDIIGDKAWAKEVYLKAISMAKSSFCLLCIADSISRDYTLGDIEWAGDVLVMAIELAKTTDDLFRIKAWADSEGFGGSNRKASEVFEKAGGIKTIEKYSDRLPVDEKPGGW